MEKKIEFGIGEGVYYLDWTDEHKISHSTVWRKSVCVTANLYIIDYSVKNDKSENVTLYTDHNNGPFRSKEEAEVAHADHKGRVLRRRYERYLELKQEFEPENTVPNVCECGGNSFGSHSDWCPKS